MMKMSVKSKLVYFHLFFYIFSRSSNLMFHQKLFLWKRMATKNEKGIPCKGNWSYFTAINKKSLKLMPQQNKQDTNRVKRDYTMVKLSQWTWTLTLSGRDLKDFNTVKKSMMFRKNLESQIASSGWTIT